MQPDTRADLEQQLQACKAELAELSTALDIERTARQQTQKALQEAERRLQEHQQVEAALRESQQLLQAILDAAPAYIYLKDKQGQYILVNHYCERILGLSQEQIVGKTDAELWPPEIAGVLQTNDKAALEAEIPLESEEMLPHQDGLQLLMSTKFPLSDATGKVYAVGGISIDITERKRAEAQLQASLQEKEVLIKEVHHRVKNNLQIISSLLDLQAQKIQDPTALEAFKESQKRIISIALIHEKLYIYDNLYTVNLLDYIQTLTTNILQAYPIYPSHISLQTYIENLSLEIDKLIPLGLIINELVSNALKHGFPENEKGSIWIYLTSKNLTSADNKTAEITLIVGNNGIKFQNIQEFQTTNSLGLQLVNILVHQLGGKIDILQNRGTEFNIRFSI
jgi:PAS domain S-box-containing protein